MPLLYFQNKTYPITAGETILDCLARQDIIIPSSCRSGVCQTCLMRCLNGTPPAAAQNGLKPALREQDYFLACLCRPEEDMEIALAGEEVAPRTQATVIAKTLLNADILRLVLRCHTPLAYRAGQFAHLTRCDGLTRSYSLAMPPREDGIIEFHVRRLPGGLMSEWIHANLCIGDAIDITGPLGNCFYTSGAPEQGLLLIGTGSGLAPLYGIVQDALRQGHNGPIRLYHGSWKPEGLYLVDEMRSISATHPNLDYIPCVDDGAEAGFREGRANQVAFADVPNLKGWRVYLCGHPEMVKIGKKRAFLAGASMQDIYADPFVCDPARAGAGNGLLAAK